MPDLLILGADLVAILLLAYGIYYRRHRRRDMLLAFIGLNIGVLAVATVLSGVAVGVGVGLGLFGVLSIIRLRSSEISQEEVAYYFSALALGLISGLQPDPRWLAPALSAMILVVIYVVDHPGLHVGYRQQMVTVDAVYGSEKELVARLEDLLGADIERIIVSQTDLVRDLTVVDVRYRVRENRSATAEVDPPVGTAASGPPAGRQQIHPPVPGPQINAPDHRLQKIGY